MATGGDYTTVFDAVQNGWSTWDFPAFGLIFIAIGLFFLARPDLVARNGRKPSRAFAPIFLIFALCWTAFAFYASYGEYSAIRDAAASHVFKTVEGKVEKFVPMPYTGHAMERFCVKETCFSYSNYVVTNGFHNAASHGGPLRDGLQVRVTYLDHTPPADSNIIVKLEVAK